MQDSQGFAFYVVLVAFSCWLRQRRSIKREYDVITVGGGLWGAAAAKYLSKDQEVCVIMPKNSIYTSHNDISRLYRIQEADVSGFWSNVSRASIQRYDEIGGDFYDKCGYIGISVGESPWRRGQVLGGSQRLAEPPYESLGITVPGLPDFADSPADPADVRVYIQTEDAGILDPRRLVERQLELFSCCGGTTVDGIVQAVEDSHHGAYVHTAAGTFFGKKVLLCPGALVNTIHCTDEQGGPIQPLPGARLKTQSVVLFEIAESDVKHLPTQTLIFAGPSKGKPDEARDDSAYIVPPRRYVDGRYYLKMGHGKHLEEEVESTDSKAIRSWYDGSGGNDEIILQTMSKLFSSLFISVTPLSAKILRNGITVDTIDGKPLVEMRSKNIGVCAGCNGYGAKGSDEIGRLAAQMILG